MVAKAKSFAQTEPELDVDEPRIRSRLNQKRSKPEHNPEGETEEKLKQQRVRDRVWSSKLKKRKRKDLTVEEVEDIVAAAQEPYKHHKDIC